MIGLHRADIGTKTFYHVFLLHAKTLLASNTESIYPVFIRKNPHLYSFFLCHAILICDSVIVLRIHFYMNELFIQAIGFVGVALFIISYQFRSNRTLLYDLIIHSWGGALSESITIISILVSIFRFGWKNLGEDSFETARQS